MSTNQDLANAVGASMRRAEAAAGAGNLGQVIAEHGTLHHLLAQVFVAANHLGAGLDWNPIAGNSRAADADAARSGGTGKDEPKAAE